MGSLKQKSKLSQLRKDLGKVGAKVLPILLDIGECFIDGLFEAMRPPHMNFAKYSGQYHLLYKSVKRLEHKGFLKTKRDGKKISIKLTKTGLKVVEKIELLDIKIILPKNWDGIWRCVIFDIPEHHKIVREMVRRKLKELGFIKIQKSVFIIPWPCKEVVEKIQEIYGVDRYIKYMEVTAFDGQENFVKRFGIHPI